MARRLRDHVGPGPLAIRDGDAVRDFSSATEVAERIAALSRIGAEGVFNIGTGRGMTVIARVRSWFGDAVDLTAESTGPSTSIVADISKLGRLLDERDRRSDRGADIQPREFVAGGD
jgi:nucleoside-diphosphate-sugar epimerase